MDVLICNKGGESMIRIKPGINIMDMLKSAGYSSYRIAQDGIFGSATMTRFRQCGRPSIGELDKLCRLLCKQPGELIEYIDDQ